MSHDKKIGMIHQQGNLAGDFTTFMHQSGWWDFACTLQYHQTIIFMGKMVFISDGWRMLWSQKVCRKCIFQWYGDPNLLTIVKKLNLWEKRAVDKSVWIKAWATCICQHNVFLYQPFKSSSLQEISRNYSNTLMKQQLLFLVCYHLVCFLLFLYYTQKSHFLLFYHYQSYNY